MDPRVRTAAPCFVYNAGGVLLYFGIQGGVGSDYRNPRAVGQDLDTRKI